MVVNTKYFIGQSENDKLILEDNKGNQFLVNIHVAKCSRFILNMLNVNMKENIEKRVVFETIGVVDVGDKSYMILEYVIKYMYYKHEYTNKEKVPEFVLNDHVVIPLLFASNFLGL